MVSIDEARQLIEDNTEVLLSEKLDLSQCIGKVLAADIHSPMDLPSFRQSAMDGFALMRADLDSGLREFKIISETQAGKTVDKILQSGEAVRIFTGAVVPENSDIVVIQEHTSFGESQLIVDRYSSEQKSNIRDIGEQVEKDSLAMQKGIRLNPAGIGFLASMGITDVDVFKAPRIGILTTGNELKSPGTDLALGEIYESNSITLESALRSKGYHELTKWAIPDDLDGTVSTISEALQSSDVLVISGGISVGDYDFVKQGLEQNGVSELFYKINQKPGKPMFFGKSGSKLIFALPGNPASLLVCYYMYVLPAMTKLGGAAFDREMHLMPLASEYEFDGKRPVFLKARIEANQVHLLEGQSSFILKSFAEANALAYIHGENQSLKAGDEVQVYPID